MPSHSRAMDILAHELRFPEGPAFDACGSLWSVELKGKGLVRWKEGVIERIPTGGAPNGTVVDHRERVLFCDAEERSIRRYDPQSQQVETLASHLDGEPLNKPNDLAFDSVGNLIFTCPGDSRQEPSGYVCALSKEGEVRKIAKNLYFPNGLAFTPDGDELILAETYRQRLWRGRWNSERMQWENPQVWAEELNGAPGPDGMAFGEDGRMYVAIYGSGSVFVISPEGTIEATLIMPGANPTNCAFDPSGKLGLVVTEAEKGLLLSFPELGPGVHLFGGAL